MSEADVLIPHEVVRRSLLDDVAPTRARREHLGLTCAEVAERLGVSQSAYAQQEMGRQEDEATRERVAAALGITAAQLDF